MTFASSAIYLLFSPMNALTYGNSLILHSQCLIYTGKFYTRSLPRTLSNQETVLCRFLVKASLETGLAI